MLTIRYLAMAALLLASVGNVWAAELARKPAIYFDDWYQDYYNTAVTKEILDAGFEVGRNLRDYPQMRWSLTWDQMKTYNVIVFVGMASDFKKEHAELIERFIKEGGGVLFMPIGMNDLDWAPSRWFFEDRLGLKVFIEQIKNPDKTFAYPVADGRLTFPIAWTDDIAVSPLTEGVTNLWYPLDRGAFYYHTGPLWLTSEWKVAVKTGPGAFTVTKADGDYIHSLKPEVDTFSSFKGRKGDFPIVAWREMGKGRVAAIGLAPQLLLWGGYIPIFNGVLMKTGAQGRPSDWSKLLLNTYRYLAEPSLKSGTLGGHVTKKEEVFDLEPGDLKAVVWDEKSSFAPPPEKVLVGIAGARSSLSTGKNTVAEWSAAAKAAGYDFLIFLEDMKKMNAEKWMQLRKECRENTTNNFLAFPGIEFEAEIGDRGFYMDDIGYWPKASVFTKDGRIRSSRGATQGGQGEDCAKYDLNFRSGMVLAPGILSWYGHQLAMGHFSHAANPTPFWNHNFYQVLSVYSRDQGRVLDDWTVDAYREVNAQKLHIAPFAINLMKATAELPKPFENGVACLAWPGSLEQLHTHLSELGDYNCAGLSTPLTVTSGPRIREWAVAGDIKYPVPRWLSGPKESDFYVTPNYRIRLRLSVESDAGLKEVAIYDGWDLYRRFLPQGQKVFAATLDAVNSRRSHFIAVVTDVNGRKAMTSEIGTENWLNRIYWCSDRCNFASWPHVHNRGVGNPVYSTEMGDERNVLNRWTFPVYGPDCGLVQGNVETLMCKGSKPDNGWVSYFDSEPLLQYRWINKEWDWYQSHGKMYVPNVDFSLQAWDTYFNYPVPPSGNAPWYPYTEKEDIFTFTKPITFDDAEEWSIAPVIRWKGQLDAKNPGEYELRLGDKRLAGKIPTDGKNVDLSGPLPSGSLIAMRLNGGPDGNRAARATTAIVRGEGLQYHLVIDTSSMAYQFQVGWRENGRTAQPGDQRQAWRFVVDSAPRAEDMTFYGGFVREFSSLEAGFSPTLLDRLERADWYTVTRGKVVWKMLPVGIKADGFAASLTVPEVLFPINSLPITISGLCPHWSAYYCETGDSARRRPVAVSPQGEARVQFDRRKKNVTLWVGHPVVCNNTNIAFDLVDAGDGRFILEANNPTDKDVEAAFTPGPGCPFLAFEPFLSRIEAGGRARFRFSGTQFTKELQQQEVK